MINDKVQKLSSLDLFIAYLRGRLFLNVADFPGALGVVLRAYHVRPHPVLLQNDAGEKEGRWNH